MKMHAFLLGMMAMVVSANTWADEWYDVLSQFREGQDSLIQIDVLPEQKLHLKGYYQSAFTKMEMVLDLPKLFPGAQEKERQVFAKVVGEIAGCMNKGRAYRVIQMEKEKSYNVVRCASISSSLFKILDEARFANPQVGKKVFNHFPGDKYPSGVEMIGNKSYQTAWITFQTPVLNHVGIQAVSCKERVVGGGGDDGCEITYLPVKPAQATQGAVSTDVKSEMAQ